MALFKKSPKETSEVDSYSTDADIPEKAELDEPLSKVRIFTGSSLPGGHATPNLPHN